MNRITLTLNEHGEVVRICSDEPIEIYFVSPHTPHDRVYIYNSVNIGPQHVHAEIGEYVVGHAADGTLSNGEQSFAKLRPSRRALKLV